MDNRRTFPLYFTCTDFSIVCRWLSLQHRRLSNVENLTSAAPRLWLGAPLARIFVSWISWKLTILSSSSVRFSTFVPNFGNISQLLINIYQFNFLSPPFLKFYGHKEICDNNKLADSYTWNKKTQNHRASTSLTYRSCSVQCISEVLGWIVWTIWM